MTTDPTVALDLDAELDQLYARLEAAAVTKLGFPDATDIDYTPLDRFHRWLLNNLGDPGTDGAYPMHTKAQERTVVQRFADLFRAPAADRWGYVTAGATEGTVWALRAARRRHPNALVYHSAATHFAIVDAVELVGLPPISIRADPGEEIDYQDLHDQLKRHRDRPAIVIANAGTGMGEAVDDIRRITTILNTLGIADRVVHVDAALSGVPLALRDPDRRPGFDLADGADSIIASGHKYFGTPMPCGVLITRASHRGTPRPATLTGSPHTTIGNSRNGHAALALRYALAVIDRDHGGLHHRDQAAHAVAAYAQQQLAALGWAPTRHPHALTVAFPAPPATVVTKWSLPVVGGRSHIICVPGITRTTVDAFLADLRAAGRPGDAPAPTPRRRGWWPTRTSSVPPVTAETP